MKVTQYKTFDLISICGGDAVLKKHVNRDDVIIADCVESFIEQLRHIPIKKIEYLQYWNRVEHQNKKVIEAYDEIILLMHKLEKEVFEIFEQQNHNSFILRIKDSKKINYLRESDLDVEFEKITKSINDRIDESLSEINDRVDLKLESLFKRSEIAFNRCFQYSHEVFLNPNLKIQNKTGYSLSEIRVD